MDSDDVLEARMAWPGVSASSSPNTACLISIFSGTASTTKSTSPKPSYSVVPWMRPRISAAWASACSCVSFSFLTRRPSWPSVTCLAFSRPWSMNFWSTSLSTTGMSAEAMTCAISPPIVPAPTTAALKTNMDWRLLKELRVRVQLPAEADQGALQGVPQRAADEEHVDDRAQRVVRLLKFVLQRERHRGAVRQRLELDALD